MGLLTVAVFFVMMFGLGALALAPVRKSSLSIALFVMSLGLGLCTFIIFALLFNALKIPIDWKFFFGFSLIGILYFIYCYRSDFKVKLNKENLLFHVGALVITVFIFFVYHQGAFSYPHLEDDDSWGHATSIKYIQDKKTLLEPDNTYSTFSEVGIFQYIDPYPPSYDALMAVLVQIEGRINWTLKFFNSLLISLSYIFFYFFASHFFGDNKKAFLSTIILAALPAYFSHFIWAISLSLPLYFVAFFGLEKMRKNHSWFIPSAISVAAATIISPTHSFYFGIFLAIYLIGRLISDKSIHLKIWMACLVGGIIPIILLWVPMLIRYKSFSNLLSGIGFASLSGTGDRSYSISDFLLTRSQNMINSPIGLGIAAICLAVLGLILVLSYGKRIFSEEQAWALITIGWLVLTIYAVNSANLPLRLSSFRTWVLLAIPVALLAGYGWDWIMKIKGNVFWIFLVCSFTLLVGYNQIALSTNNNTVSRILPSINPVISIIAIPLLFGIGYIGSLLFKGIGLDIKRVQIIVFSIIIFLLFLTSFSAKYDLNTTPWWYVGSFFYGGQFNQKSYEGYMSLSSLPPGSKIFTLTYRHAPNIIGMDHFTCNYCDEDIKMRSQISNVTNEQLYSWLKNRYDYVTLDADYGFVYGVEKAQSRANEMIASGKFQIVKNNENFILFKVL
ncbi:MAG: hypothetical protein AABX51_03540 [Nanoarchaeota archaeon]